MNLINYFKTELYFKSACVPVSYAGVILETENVTLFCRRQYMIADLDSVFQSSTFSTC